MSKIAITIVIVAVLLISGPAILSILYNGSGQSAIHPVNGEDYVTPCIGFGCPTWSDSDRSAASINYDDPVYLARSAFGVLIVTGTLGVLGAGAFILRSARRRTLHR